MSVHVQIIQGPLPGTIGTGEPGAGAMLVFEGIVRPSEDDRPIAALEYEAYEPMASKQLQALGQTLVRDLGLISLRCMHSVGRVGVGQASFRLEIASRHRREAIDAMDMFIDGLKRDVPIWKTPVFV